MKLRVLLPLLLLAACSTGTEHMYSDWERENAARLAKEGDDALTPLPPAPRPGDLIAFSAGPGSSFRFHVDPGTLHVNPDGLVRYVLVARSNSGAENVAYEAINCRSYEYRLYATGRPDGSWQRVDLPWRPLSPRTPAQRVLAAEYFCPKGISIANAAEGAMALRRGGHPLADSPNPGSAR